MVIPFGIDWVEVPSKTDLFKPELPSLSEKLFLPDVNFIPHNQNVLYPFYVAKADAGLKYLGLAIVAIACLFV